MSKFKYAVTNGDSVIALIYEDEKYGRTMVVLGKVDLNNPLVVWNGETNIPIADKDFTEFIFELLPIT